MVWADDLLRAYKEQFSSEVIREMSNATWSVFMGVVQDLSIYFCLRGWVSAYIFFDVVLFCYFILFVELNQKRWNNDKKWQTRDFPYRHIHLYIVLHGHSTSNPITIPCLFSVLVIYQDFPSIHNDNNHHFLNSVICSLLVLIQDSFVTLPLLPMLMILFQRVGLCIGSVC